VTFYVNNPNVYEIALLGMDMQGTIGKTAPGQMSYNQTIDRFVLPANGFSGHVLSIVQIVPGEVDKIALLKDIALDCTDLYITSVVKGTTKVRVFGVTIPFAFGPMEVTSKCFN
jgi:hypothetical protein